MAATLVSVAWIRDHIKETLGRDVTEHTVSRWGSEGRFGPEVWERGRKRYRIGDVKRAVRQLPQSDGRRKLTDAQVVEIRKDATATLREIAERFGISESYVSLLRRKARRVDAGKGKK